MKDYPLSAVDEGASAIMPRVSEGFMEITRLTEDSAHAGVCNNVLAPGELVDVPSGNAVVNGIPVEVTPL